MNRQYLVGAIVLGIAACTAPGPEKSEADAVEVSGVADDNRLICKTEPQSGSLMKKKVCLTAAQWERMEKGAQEYLEKKRQEIR